ncbi:hypothetical protein BS78_06G263500 [Paspalum vaginatum]|nr:hypothetical protein BS78_06G263500 [Paspalum vaginatum]
MALALGLTPLTHLALAPPPISSSQASLLLLPHRRSPARVSISRSLRSRVVAAVASKEPELGGGGSEGGDGAGGSGGDSDPREAVASKEPELGGGGSEGGDGAGGSGGGGGSDPREGNQEGEGEGEGEEEMGQGLSMSQKLTLVYAALVGAGGVMGYMKSGSQKSLAAGGLSALVLFFVHTQLPVRPVFASSIGLGISAALLSVMGSRFKKSGKIFPAGVVSLVSLVMVGGYFHGILRSSHA